MPPPVAWPRRLKVMPATAWRHHRGGWPYAIRALARALHSPEGVPCHPVVEHAMDELARGAGAWVGFLHMAPWHPYRSLDLDRVLRTRAWEEARPRCRGVWVLSAYQRRWLERSGVGVPVETLPYPTARPRTKFSLRRYLAAMPRCVVFVGEYLRDYEAFHALRAPGHAKLLVRSPAYGDLARGVWPDPAVTVLDWLSTANYDALLASSVVFLRLLDAGANTTIVECVARGTPVLVNRVGGVEEYLGPEYPFYFTSLCEAERKLRDEALVRRTVAYLRRWPLRRELTAARFVARLASGGIYAGLADPPA